MRFALLRCFFNFFYALDKFTLEKCFNIDLLPTDLNSFTGFFTFENLKDFHHGGIRLEIGEMIVDP